MEESKSSTTTTPPGRMGGSSSSEVVEEVTWHDRCDPDAEKRGVAEALKEFGERKGRQRLEEAKKTYQRIKSDLVKYEVGSKLRLVKFFPTNIKEIEAINIALIGPTGSGKSSFINIAEKVMIGEATVVTQSQGKEGTVQLEEYLTRFNFRLIDTRGCFELDEKWHKELQNILTGKIRVGQTIVRETDDSTFTKEQSMRSEEAPLGEQIHGVICVMVDNDPRLKQYTARMKSIKEYLKEKGYSPVGALAFEREKDFKNETRRREVVENLSAAFGIPMDRTFPFINHLASGTDISMDPDSILNVLDILDTAVMAAEKFIKVRLQREQHSNGGQAQAAAPQSQSVSDFIQTVGKAQHWDEGRIDSLVKLLHDGHIYDVTALKQYWEGISPKLTMGMRSAIKRALSM